MRKPPARAMAPFQGTVWDLAFRESMAVTTRARPAVGTVNVCLVMTGFLLASNIVSHLRG